MTTVTAAKFLGEIDKSLSPVLILAGDSKWEQERILGAISESMGDDTSRDVFQSQRTEPTQDEVRSLLLDLSSPPVFGDRRLVVVRNGDAVWKVGKDGLRRIAESKAVENVAVLLCEKIPPGMAQCKTVKVVTCKVPGSGSKFSRGKEKRDWLLGRAKDLGVSLNHSAIETLLDSTGEDQFTLDEELKKLALWAASIDGSEKPREVTHEIVHELVAFSAGRGLDLLLDAVLDRRLPAALKLVTEMRDHGFRHFSGKKMTGESWSSMVLNGLIDRFRKILGVLESSGETETRELLGIHSDGYWRYLSRDAKRIGRIRAEKGLRSLALAEFSIRTRGIPPYEAVHRAVIEIARGSETRKRDQGRHS